MIKAIVCVDEKFGIGKKNDLLFNLLPDMQHFRAHTKNSIVVCGYNTLLSFPNQKPLPGRTTICLCPSEVSRTDCFCIHDFDECVALIKELSKTTTVWIIGGAMLYKSMLPYYDEIELTKVYADGEAAAFFPNVDEMPEFEVISENPVEQYEDLKYQFITYKRKAFYF
jgi:dihydrofolate reductase